MFNSITIPGIQQLLEKENSFILNYRRQAFIIKTNVFIVKYRKQSYK